MYDKNEFAVLIPTHGRSDRVFTYDTLRKSGYTGKIYLVCDDEDKQLEAYQKKYNGEVVVFSKADYAGKFDKMDNFGNKACVVYARNAIWDIAKSLGLKYISVADDDYYWIGNRIGFNGKYKPKTVRNADDVFSSYIDFLKSSQIDCICLAQGGDYIGGANSAAATDGFKVSRKMMNLYFFDVSKPIEFIGSINEDLTSSVVFGGRGRIILTSY